MKVRSERREFSWPCATTCRDLFEFFHDRADGYAHSGTHACGDDRIRSYAGRGPLDAAAPGSAAARPRARIPSLKDWKSASSSLHAIAQERRIDLIRVQNR